MPDSGDFRLDINNEAQAELRNQYEDVMRERLKDAMDDVWQRLLEPLKNMSARLEYGADGKPLNGHFKGTIVDNVMDIVDLMKHVNIAKDPRMEQVRQDLVHALRGVSYEGLKDSETMRVDTKRKVDDIISGLGF